MNAKISGGILKYFTLTRKSLLSPDGPLSKVLKVVPSEGILLANKEVKEVLEGDGTRAWSAAAER